MTISSWLQLIVIKQNHRFHDFCRLYVAASSFFPEAKSPHFALLSRWAKGKPEEEIKPLAREEEEEQRRWKRPQAAQEEEEEMEYRLQPNNEEEEEEEFKRWEKGRMIEGGNDWRGENVGGLTKEHEIENDDN